MRAGAVLLALALFTSMAWSYEHNEIGKAAIDESSFANLDEVRAEHFHLKLNINFEKKRFSLEAKR